MRKFDHVVLSLRDLHGVTGTLYIDADGAATAESIIQCWRTRERLPNILLEDPADEARFSSRHIDESWSAWLAQKLEAHFGKPHPFELHALLGRMK